MAIELICYECGTEYWGPSIGAKCGSCDYIFSTMDKINYRDLTRIQLNSWGCKYDYLSVGEKPNYDLLICDRTKRIEEL